MTYTAAGVMTGCRIDEQSWMPVGLKRIADWQLSSLQIEMLDVVETAEEVAEELLGDVVIVDRVVAGGGGGGGITGQPWTGLSS